MNIEIANHLVQLRKEKGYSQETLAEKLGLSRQAVSKWERAEASPDTDNLIALAKLYHMTLDELLLMDTENSGEKDVPGDCENDVNSEPEEEKKQQVHVSFKGIHVIDGDQEVHVAPGLIYVKENGAETVNINKHKVFVKGKEDPEHSRWLTVPCPFLVTAIFLILGFAADAWHPGWLVFFSIPLYYSLLDAIVKREPNHFAFPVLAAAIYLALGLFGGWWAWGWIVFLTVPIYYCIFPEKKK